MEPPAAGATTHKIRVLVADDEEVIAQTLATILELAGYEICAVYDGETAVQLMELFRPDLIITDVTMPGVPGIEVAFAARQTLPRCKVLLFTGFTGLGDLLRLKGAAELPFEVVMKPIRPTDLLQRIRQTLCSEHPALLVPIEIEDDRIH